MGEIALTIAGMIIAYIAGYLISVKNSQKVNSLEEKEYFAFTILAILLGFICGRLTFLLIDNTLFKVNFIKAAGEINVFGVVGGIIVAAIITGHLYKKKTVYILNAVTIPCLILLSFVRIVDFIAGTNYGFMVNGTIAKYPYAVYVSSIDSYVVAVFNFELLISLLLIVLTVYLSRKQDQYLSVVILGLYACAKTLLESLRRDALMIGMVRATQVISILVVIVILILLYKRVSKALHNNNISIVKYLVILITNYLLIILAFLAEFFMGTEVRLRNTTIITIVMLIICATMILMDRIAYKYSKS